MSSLHQIYSRRWGQFLDFVTIHIILLSSWVRWDLVYMSWTQMDLINMNLESGCWPLPPCYMLDVHWTIDVVDICLWAVLISFILLFTIVLKELNTCLSWSTIFPFCIISLSFLPHCFYYCQSYCSYKGEPWRNGKVVVMWLKGHRFKS